MFSHRSYKEELLDGDTIPFEDIRQNMMELDFINRWLGGHAITVAGFKKLAPKKKNISICEVGCGGGDNLLAIDRYCSKNNIKAELTGIDIKAECIDYAKSSKSFASKVTYINNDYRQVIFKQKPDVIFSSLFCHHFTSEQLLFQFNWMKENSTIGFFINDLQRHFLAYYSISFLTRFFSSSYLVKNDAPLSVLRGFTKKELSDLCNKANLYSATIEWKWAFRFLLVYKHGAKGQI
jgi:2-polyprenyl-3-methyl-5-hydroxy-6-metoxy-1,4-benzoquinol methylase